MFLIKIELVKDILIILELLLIIFTTFERFTLYQYIKILLLVLDYPHLKMSRNYLNLSF